jgi:spore coat polysaccharide biosynthesis protein SpsF
MKVTAIIQARMTSTRLPGKVMMKVLNKPLIEYQIDRLRNCKKISEIIVATTTNKEDDRIIEFANRNEIRTFRGSEQDVLDRYYQCAKKVKAKHVMRLTGDCPLIDPLICDKLTFEYERSGADYIQTGPTFAEGVDCEIFSFSALIEAWENASLKSEREHCTLYLRNNPEKFMKITLNNSTDDSRYRFTVDRREDFLVVKAIIEYFMAKRNIDFGTNDIKNFLDTHAEIFKINSDVIRNEGLIISLKEDGEFTG